MPQSARNSLPAGFHDEAGSTTSGRLTTSQVAGALGVDRFSGSLVAIDPEALTTMVDHISNDPFFLNYHRSTWGDAHFWNSEALALERSQYFAIGNAVNFRFWRLEQGRVIPAVGIIKGEKLRGAMYMWRRLRVCLDEGRLPILNARFLATLSDSDFDELFGDDTGSNPLSVAREERIANLRDLGTHLLSRWDGQFYHLVQAAHGSPVEFARLSREIRAFDDPLYKLTMVNAILHSGSGIASFDGEPLPAIDYHVLKQLLRQGVILPLGSLKGKLITQQLLSDQESMELRRAALWALVEISARTGLSGEILDNSWWWNRLKCTDQNPVCQDPETAPECPFLYACSKLVDYSLPLAETRYY